MPGVRYIVQSRIVDPLEHSLNVPTPEKVTTRARTAQKESPQVYFEDSLDSQQKQKMMRNALGGATTLPALQYQPALSRCDYGVFWQPIP